VNVSGIYHEAATVADQLKSAGYAVSSTSTAAAPSSVTETVIRYQPGDVATAMGLMGHLSGAVMLTPDATVAPGSLTLDVGSVLSVSPGASGGAPTGAAGGTPTAAAAPAGSPPPSGVPAAGVAAPTTSIPTALHQPPSSAQDQAQPYDPGPCTPGS
jgi:hypothetical protein